MGISYANKGLGSGPSVPIFQYFRFCSRLLCLYCNVFHLSLFWFSWYQTSPILGWTKTSTENHIQKIFDLKWTQKYDNVGGFKWSQSEPCPLGYLYCSLVGNTRHNIFFIFDLLKAIFFLFSPPHFYG